MSPFGKMPTGNQINEIQMVRNTFKLHQAPPPQIVSSPAITNERAALVCSLDDHFRLQRLRFTRFVSGSSSERAATTRQMAPVNYVHRPPAFGGLWLAAHENCAPASGLE